MHILLSKLLDKRKIKHEEPSPEEKSDFDRWEKILSSGEITVKKIEESCRNQLVSIDAQMRSVDNSTQKNERLICLHSVYSAIIGLLSGPEAEKQALERYLSDLLQKE